MSIEKDGSFPFPMTYFDWDRPKFSIGRSAALAVVDEADCSRPERCAIPWLIVGDSLLPLLYRVS